MSDLPTGYLSSVEIVPGVNVYYAKEPKKKRRRRNRKSSIKRGHEIKKSLIARDGDCCHYCHTQVKLPISGVEHTIDTPDKATIDHVVARGNGGSNRQTNLVIACYQCNNGFGDKTIKCKCEFCTNARQEAQNII